MDLVAGINEPGSLVLCVLVIILCELHMRSSANEETQQGVRTVNCTAAAFVEHHASHMQRYHRVSRSNLKYSTMLFVP